MALSMTIAGSAVAFDEDSLELIRKVNERMELTCTLLDYTGSLILGYQERIVATDSVLGVIFSGFLIDDKQSKQNIGTVDPTIEHQIDTIDARLLADNRTTSRSYTTPVFTGKILLDFWNDALNAEGINAYAAMRSETLQADFAQGTLVGTVSDVTNATLSATDGDLELIAAGSTVTITEATTAQFATGTLTNVTATSNSLIPTTVSAISLAAQLPFSIGAGANSLYLEIWSGSMTVASNDTLNYDIWISSTSPAFNAGVDLNFSDGTSLHNYVGPVDQNFLPPSPLTDLSSYAKDTWYTRNIALTSALNGKTINSVCVAVAGSSIGTYNVFFKNIYLSSNSGSPFFSTSATATQVNPPTTFANAGYIGTLALVGVVPALTGVNASRVSSAHSISAAQLVGASYISWNAATPAGSNFEMAVSYDGNTFLLCTNGQPLPGLPGGSNVAGTSLYLQEIFSSGTAPTALPTLASVLVTITSAPNATKSDVVDNYGTSAQWNAGTLLGTVVNGNGDLTLGTYTRNWNDNLITSQSFFPSLTGSPTQAASGGTYTITVPVSGGSAYYGLSRFDFAGVAQDFIAEWDMQYNNSSGIGPSLIYRTTGWSAYDLNFGYLVQMQTTTLQLGYGSNNNNASGVGTFTSLASISGTYSLNTNYHFKLVVKGSLHQVYVNGSSTPTISVTDSTYASTGNIGFRVGGALSGGSTVGKIDNFAITPATFGTWISASQPLSALTTIGGSVISWLETLASGAPSSTAIVQTSIDGGSTYQLCANNAVIPGLTSGVNASSLSLLVKMTLFSTTVAGDPVIGGLNTRVLGAYPLVTGTRTTAPAGNDMSITRTSASTWGNAFDGQAWAKVGTATAATGSSVATLTNTTGDVFELLGIVALGDGDVTDLVQLSAGTISAGLVLRYVDSSHYYYLALSTTAISIVKNIGAGDITIATTPGTYSTGVGYRMRFRAIGIAPTVLQGKVWAAGTLEPGVNLGILSTTAPQWGVVGSD